MGLSDHILRNGLWVTKVRKNWNKHRNMEQIKTNIQSWIFVRSHEWSLIIQITVYSSHPLSWHPIKWSANFVKSHERKAKTRSSDCIRNCNVILSDDICFISNVNMPILNPIPISILFHVAHWFTFSMRCYQRPCWAKGVNTKFTTRAYVSKARIARSGIHDTHKLPYIEYIMH